MGKRLLHSTPDDGRMAPARHPSLHRFAHERVARAASHAGGHRRRIPRAARDQLLVWVGLVAIGPGAVADGLPSAVGPEGLLGHQSRDEHCGAGAAHRAGAAEAGRRRSGLWPSHLDALLRFARRRAACRSDFAFVLAHISVPPTWYYSQRPETPAR